MGFRGRRHGRRTQRLRRQDEMYQDMQKEYDEKHQESKDGNDSDDSDDNDDSNDSNVRVKGRKLNERTKKNGSSSPFRQAPFHIKNFFRKSASPQMAFFKFFFYCIMYLVLRHISKTQEAAEKERILNEKHGPQNAFPEPQIVFSDITPGQAPKVQSKRGLKDDKAKVKDDKFRNINVDTVLYKSKARLDSHESMNYDVELEDDFWSDRTLHNEF